MGPCDAMRSVFHYTQAGSSDQFGGAKGSKYMKYNLKRLLSDISDKSMTEQHRILEDEFEKWKGTVNQIDDVTILGVRI